MCHHSATGLSLSRCPCLVRSSRPVLARQTQVLRRFAQVEHRQGHVLAVALADPVQQPGEALQHQPGSRPVALHREQESAQLHRLVRRASAAVELAWSKSVPPTLWTIRSTASTCPSPAGSAASDSICSYPWTPPQSSGGHARRPSRQTAGGKPSARSEIASRRVPPLNVCDARDQLASIIDRARSEHEPVYLARRGRRVAAVVDADDLGLACRTRSVWRRRRHTSCASSTPRCAVAFKRSSSCWRPTRVRPLQHHLRNPGRQAHRPGPPSRHRRDIYRAR